MPTSETSSCTIPLSNVNAKRCFDLVHCDVWGSYHATSLSSAHCFLTLVDDRSQCVWVYLIRNKSQTLKLLIDFYYMLKTQFECSIKSFRSDNGLEFVSGMMQEFYRANGIIHQTSCTDTPQQNGRVERKHRHLLNVAPALRFEAHLPIKFWGECILTPTYLINSTPTPLLSSKTPYEILFRKRPRYDHLRIFGSLCYVSC